MKNINTIAAAKIQNTVKGSVPGLLDMYSVGDLNPSSSD
jgi:hypothetical protein